MRYRKLISVLFAVTIIFSGFQPQSSAESEGGLIVRFAPKPGSIAVYRLSLRGVTTTAIGDMDQKIDVDTEMYISQACEKVADNRITLVTSIDSGKSNVNGDVTVPETVGARYQVVMEPSGKILESSQSIGGETTQMQIVFPDKPLRVGDSWEQIIPIQNGKLNLRATYALEGFDVV